MLFLVSEGNKTLLAFCFSLFQFLLFRDEPHVHMMIVFPSFNCACNLLSRRLHRSLMEWVRRVCTVCDVCHQRGAETMRAWVCRMSSGWHTAFLTHSHSGTLCGCLLSLKYRCGLRTKAAVLLCNLKPKAEFLSCTFICPERERFSQRATLERMNIQAKRNTGLCHLCSAALVACEQFMVGSEL